MIDVAFAVPGDVTAPTGGYAYARKILEMMPDYGVQPHRLQLSAAYPYPKDDDLAATRRTFAQLHPETSLIIDGLALGAMPPLLVNDIRQPFIALVHHPLAYETGISTAQSRQFLAFERHALARAWHVVVSSNPMAQLLVQEYSVPEEKITVAVPGTMPALRAEGSHTEPRLLAVGAVIPRKGYTVLVEALTRLAAEKWTLTIAGALDRDPKYVTAVREAIIKSGLRSRIELAGAVEDRELQRLYARANVFVMPSLFEGYGMVLTEAIARGLPIVCTTGGAIPDTVPAGASIKVEPGDAEALAEALQRILGDASLRRELAEASWQAGRNLPRWEDCARSVAGVVKAMDGRQA